MLVTKKDSQSVSRSIYLDEAFFFFFIALVVLLVGVIP